MVNDRELAAAYEIMLDLEKKVEELEDITWGNQDALDDIRVRSEGLEAMLREAPPFGTIREEDFGTTFDPVQRAEFESEYRDWYARVEGLLEGKKE